MEILREIRKVIQIDVEPIEDAQRRYNSNVGPLKQKIFDLTDKAMSGQGGTEVSLELGRALLEAERIRVDRVYQRRALNVGGLRIPLPPTYTPVKII